MEKVTDMAQIAWNMPYLMWRSSEYGEDLVSVNGEESVDRGS
jgi:hypothetical protein